MMAGRSSSTESTDLLDRLDRALAESGRGSVIATDGDGTLWDGDIGEELFLAALKERSLREPALEALLGEARAQNIDTSATMDANDVAELLFQALRDGRYDEESAFSMMAWVFAGWSVAELAVLSRRVLDDMEFDTVVRPELHPLLGWAMERQVPIWLVSASPLPVVLEAARRLGVLSNRVVAMSPAVDHGVVQPCLAKRATYGEGKLLRLREVTDAPLLAAFGDSSYDAAMLGVAKLPVAVFPTEGLRSLAEGMAGLLVIGSR